MSAESIVKGKVGWRAPSNLAIIKYWGKHGRQLPRNPSISLTLEAAYTEMTIHYGARVGDQIVSAFTFEGRDHSGFCSKIERYLLSVSEELPWLREVSLEISSTNSFPHSSGIASSASSMAALALCLCDIQQHVLAPYETDEVFYQHASHLARLASGSASRSVYPHLAMWGQHLDVPGSNDLYAIPYQEVDPVFATYHDDICIVSDRKKAVSSTAGHQLMEDNPYAAARYEQATDRLTALLDILRKGDVPAFGQLAEDEAMALHGMMMCSDPSYLLIEPQTVEMIQRIRAYRDSSGVPIYFSLDAGPNIHLLYPHAVHEVVAAFIDDDLRPLCVDGRIIKDSVGQGPKRLF